MNSDQLRVLGILFVLGCGSGGTIGSRHQANNVDLVVDMAEDTTSFDSGPGEDTSGIPDVREESSLTDALEILDILGETPDTPAEVAECTTDADCAGKVPRLSACETAWCDPATWTCGKTAVSDGTPCDDGNPCTSPDTCASGVCGGGVNACDCDKDADCAKHEDGNLCNGTLMCDKAQAPFQCVVDPNTVVVCGDDLGLPCRETACEPATGKCVDVWTHEGEPCDDHDPCTTGDTCAKGECVGEATVFCDDDNPCTDDACVFGQGCVSVNNALPCDDGEICTVGDACAEGKCVPGLPDPCDDGNPCTLDACQKGVGCGHEGISGAACEDGDFCTTDETCSEGLCVGGQTADCDDHEVCTDDSCDPARGCVHTANALLCDDGDGCTLMDRCWDGTCVGGPALDCDDADPCTMDSCDDGVCVHEPLDCNDGDPCTQDSCSPETGECFHAPNDCKDGNACTEDACDAETGECLHEPLSGTPCDDKDLCSDGDECQDGTCVPGSMKECPGSDLCHIPTCAPATGECMLEPVDCEDGDPCTLDACRPSDGLCERVVKVCDDGDPLTDDYCEAQTGDCLFIPKGCKDDMDPCTIEKLDPVTGICVYLPRGCEDGDPCTVDFCNPTTGRCLHPPRDVSDGNPCTDDWCVPGTGEAGHVAKDCSDDNPCTRDLCEAETGKCLHPPADPTDGDPCTVDSCDPKTGEFAHVPKDCDDANACTKDVCHAGVCVHTPFEIDDHDPCTTDSCDPGTGEIQHVPVVCDDADPCTVDTCDPNSGNCVFTAKVCDDADPCTDDWCDDETGECVFDLMYGMECDDGDPCTEGDTCGGVLPTEPMKAKEQSCQGWLKDCDDGDDCTADSCDGRSGECLNEVVEDQPCDDGDDCTTNDRCRLPLDKVWWEGGYCSGDPLDCDDSDECTDDYCDSEMGGCVNDFLWEEPCDDGDPCTEDDMCLMPVLAKAGKGSPNCYGWDKDCDDDNDCTADSCDSDTGDCVHRPETGLNCDDGDPCTVSDQCAPDGQCVGKAMDCADSNQCTDDWCDSETGGCEHDFRWGASCDDGNACTVNDRCMMPAFDFKVEDTYCHGEPMDCDDDEACTEDWCSEGKCMHTPDVGARCDDGDDCTGDDACSEQGTCDGTPLDCDDGNDCTADSCEDGGCVNDFQPGHPCDDGDPCTIDDSCDGASEYCRGGDYRDCDDGNDCTSDWCDSETGDCVNEVEDGAECDDGDPCTEGDSCDSEGECVGEAIDCDDGNDCTADACDNGDCVSSPSAGKACDDGFFCTVEDQCNAEGECEGAPRTCDDQNACTLDGCDLEQDECFHLPDPDAVEGPKGAASCSDGKDNDCDGKTDGNDPDCLLEVTAVSPDDGPEHVTATVVISGNGFDTATAVRFGNAAATVLAKTSTTLTVSVPGQAAGRVDVTVVLQSSVSATLKNGYMFTGTASVLPWVTWQAPAVVDVPEGKETGLLFGRVWDPNVTQGGDPNRITAEVCYGPVGTLPWGVFGWTCVAASHNPLCGNCGNNYEYMATFKAPVGTWDMFFRFSLDASVHYKYGDRNGSNDGCTPDQAAKLYVRSTCVPVCSNKECGDDGCGGSCGTCGSGKDCVAGKCVVTSLDVSGWHLVRVGSTEKTYTIPAGTVLQPGGYIVFGRKGGQAAFETFWGRTMPSDAWYFDTNDNGTITVNGSYQFLLRDAAGTVIDGPTYKFSAEKNDQRKVPPAAADMLSSWVETAASVVTNATPGAGQTSSPDYSGIYISEVADALGTGNYVYEFVELYYDGP